MTVRKMTSLSVAVALAMVLSFLESLVPPLVSVPGVKVGLANIVTVFLLYVFGWREAGAVSLIRVFLSALLFGSTVSLVYALSGAILSFVGMVLLKLIPLSSEVSVSIVGGVLHNAGQIIAACFIMESAAIIGYLPPLVISGTVAGIAVGTLAAILVKKLRGLIIK
jgi:heptaprenyl diphosphate synthase